MCSSKSRYTHHREQHHSHPVWVACLENSNHVLVDMLVILHFDVRRPIRSLGQDRGAQISVQLVHKLTPVIANRGLWECQPGSVATTTWQCRKRYKAA